MTAHTCSLCNTELLDNVIFCYGRCNKIFHYTCIGMTRTTVETYKKVQGLKWQCSDCLNESNGIWMKLDELTTLVNEIKSTITLFSMVKSAVAEAFSEQNSGVVPFVESNIDTNGDIHENVNNQKRRKKRPTKKTKKFASSTPTNGNINSNTIRIPKPSRRDPTEPFVTHESTLSSTDNTVIASAGRNPSPSIRTAERRTYLWMSGFHYATTAEQVVNLVKTTLDVQEYDVICRSLKSNRRTYTDFDHVSFRVGLKPDDVKDALSTGKWPKGVNCKLFNSKNSNARQPVKLG